MAHLLYAGESDVGFQRHVNEDYILVKELDSTTTLAMVVDGAGSTGNTFQPASIVALEIYNIIKRVFSANKDNLLNNAEAFLEEAVYAAGRVLSAFKVANEELYHGYGASVSCCLFYNSSMSFAHTGNTRINMIRRNKKTGNMNIKQLTKDQTEGQILVDKGEIDFNEYHVRPERLRITGGLGVVAEPVVQTFTVELRDNDFFLITSDGIHYAIRPDIMLELLAHSEQCIDCVKGLIQAAKVEEYADNMAAVLCWYTE